MARDYDNVFDPSLESDLSGLAVAPEERDLLASLMAAGRKAGETEQPKGYAVGGTYIAANPLEHLAAALKSGLGQAKERQATRAYRSNLDAEKSARANAMRRYGLLMEQGEPTPVQAEPEQPAYSPPGGNVFPGFGRIN